MNKFNWRSKPRMQVLYEHPWHNDVKELAQKYYDTLTPWDIDNFKISMGIYSDDDIENLNKTINLLNASVFALKENLTDVLLELVACEDSLRKAIAKEKEDEEKWKPI